MKECPVLQVGMSIHLVSSNSNTVYVAGPVINGITNSLVKSLGKELIAVAIDQFTNSGM
jgi:hypothetical protein